MEHYRQQGATILTVQVTAEMTANQVYEALYATQPQAGVRPGTTQLIVREDTGIIDGFLAYRLDPDRQERSMSITEVLIKSLDFARARTLGLLDTIEKEPDPRPFGVAARTGPGTHRLATDARRRHRGNFRH